MPVRLFANGKLIPEGNYTLELARPKEKWYRIIYHEESGFDSNQVLELIELPDDQPQISRVLFKSMFAPEEKDDPLITVCDRCERASCWHGEFMCEEAKEAGTKEMPLSKLRQLKLEHPRYWERG
jgi:hypothetical protein